MSLDHRAEAVGVREQLLDGALDSGGAAVVDLGEDLVLQLQDALDLLGQDPSSKRSCTRMPMRFILSA